MRTAGLILVAAIVLGGCDDSSPSTSPPAGLTDLLGAYRTQPFAAVDATIVRAVDDICRRDLAAEGIVVGDLQPILADARGEGRVILTLTGPDGRVAHCQVRLEAGGGIDVEGTGVSEGEPIGPTEIRISSASSVVGQAGVGRQTLEGIIGAQVSAVHVTLFDGSRLIASTGAGRFAVWWPLPGRAVRLQGYDAAGNLVADAPM
jgi:hypothetical protein